MNYQSQPDQTGCTSVPYGDIYVLSFMKFGSGVT